MASNGTWRPAPRDASPYTEEEAQALDQAKRTHRATTESAQRALKTANRTRDLAANTLEELQRQGDKLEVIDQDLHAIDADVQESKGLLKYMQRCCLCFLCACCECDSAAQQDKTRKQRVKARDRDREDFKSIVSGSRQAATSVPVGEQKVVATEEGARGALFETKADARKARAEARRRNSAYDIGKGLAEPDRQEILKETEAQEQTLDAIGDALEDMKNMGRAMHDELGHQEAVLDRVTGHVDKTHAGLSEVQASAEKTLGKAGAKKVHRKYMPSQTQVAQHIASASRHL